MVIVDPKKASSSLGQPWRVSRSAANSRSGSKALGWRGTNRVRTPFAGPDCDHPAIEVDIVA